MEHDDRKATDDGLKKQELPDKKETDSEDSEGNYMALGMCVGMLMGMSIGQLFFDSMATGLSVGVCLGMTVGICVKKK